MRPPLRRRFYSRADVGQQPDGFAVLLDGKPIRTPAVRALVVPVRSLAFALPKNARLDVATVTVAGQNIAATAKQDGDRVTLELAKETVVNQGQTLEVNLRVQA